MTMKLTDSRRWTGRFLTALAILVLVFSSGLNQSALAEMDIMGETWVDPPVLQAVDGTIPFKVHLTAMNEFKNIGDKNNMLSSGIPEFDNDVVRPTAPVLL